jgi:hypothetical protein
LRWNWEWHLYLCDYLNFELIIIRAVLHSFFLSRVSHKGEFYLERFLMRQHCTQLNYLFKSCLCIVILWLWVVNLLRYFIVHTCELWLVIGQWSSCYLWIRSSCELVIVSCDCEYVIFYPLYFLWNLISNLKTEVRAEFAGVFTKLRTVGWPGPIFSPGWSGWHGPKISPQARAWAECQARGPSTTCRAGPKSCGSCLSRARAGACRAGPMAIYTRGWATTPTGHGAPVRAWLIEPGYCYKSCSRSEVIQ